MSKIICILAILIMPLAARAGDESPVYLLAIGNNLPPQGKAGRNLKQLSYADDDAAAVYTFFSRFTQEAILLVDPDDETQQRFPEVAKQARPPTEAELVRSVKRLAERIKQDRDKYRDPVVVVFYSGHGFIAPRKGAALALQGGRLTQKKLYDRVLAKLEARYIHLIVDACHAEAVVRPRGGKPDASARTGTVTKSDKLAWQKDRTLHRFSNVGAVIATATHQQSHEWTEYGQGVFTHEVLSGLRGGADVNGDLKIEYSELHAFLSAANRKVKDPRGRLEVLVHPPAKDQRVALVDLGKLGDRFGFLTGEAGRLDHLHLEDERGNRLLDLFVEQGYPVNLALPPDQTLFLRSVRGESRLHVAAGDSKPLEKLRLAPSVTSSRGSIAASFWKGLFTTRFGPSYYLGFTDSAGLVPVPLEAKPDRSRAADPAVLARSPDTNASAASDWSPSLPADRLSGYLEGAGLRLLVAAAGEKTEAQEVAVVLQAALREVPRVNLVMNASGLGDVQKLDDKAIVEKAKGYPLDLVGVVRVFDDASGQPNMAIITFYDKSGTVRNAFSAERGRPIAFRTGSGETGDGVDTHAAEAVASVLKTAKDEKVQNLEQYEDQRIEVISTSVTAPGGQQVSVYTPPVLGRTKTPMEWDEFYKKVGRRDLASSYNTWSTTKSVMNIGGIVLMVIGGAIMMYDLATISSDDSSSIDGSYQEHDLTNIYLGGGLAVGGSLMWTVGMLINPQPVSGSQVRSLAETYNLRLREQMGLESADVSNKPEEPMSVQYALTPIAVPSGAGLALVGRF